MGDSIKIEVYNGQEAVAAMRNTALHIDRFVPFFHSSQFLRLWEGLRWFEPWIFIALRDDEPIAGICGVIMKNPLGGSNLSSRFISWGGPVFFNEDEDSAFVKTTADREDSAFVIPRQAREPTAGSKEDEGITAQLLNSLKRELPSYLVYIEIRNLENRESIKNAFLQGGFRELPYINMGIELTKSEDPFTHYTPARQRQIRQAGDVGISIREAETGEEVRMWYSSLKTHYRKVVHKPLPPYAFFLNFFNMSRRYDCGKIFLAFYEGDVIGGAMVPASLRQETAYIWYISCQRKVEGAGSPTALLYHHIIKYYSDRDFNYLDLMGGGVKGQASGLRKYKSAFGAKESVDGRFILVRRPLVYAAGKMVINLFQK